MECDGTSATVISDTVCKVSSFSLLIAPYNLEKGDSVQVRIVAINYYGESLSSPVGNGALIQTVSTEPINLSNVPSITNAEVIGLSW